MELKDFVADTLTQISEGILEVQRQAGDSGLYVCPRMTTGGSIAKDGESSRMAHKVSFDIAVEAVASKGTDGTGGAKFRVEVLSCRLDVGSSSKETDNSTSRQTSRIQFDIPVVWPTVAPKDKHDPVLEKREKKEYDPFKVS